MEVQFGPNSIDAPSLLYKLQRKIKVFNTNQPLPNRGYNLVASTSKYGFVFVATPMKTLSVYYLKELIDKESEPQHLSVKLQVSPTHIAVNCNEEWLAVFGGQMLLVYKCMDFQNTDIRPSVSIKCDVSPSTFLSALQWNPCIPDTIGLVFFDGTLLVSQVSTMQVKKIQSNARCLCWSPKGKQLVTGNNDGTLSQFKPDLSPMKMVPPPNLFESAPVEVLAIYWIATYQFAVTYKNATDNSRPAVTIVNTPKGGRPFCHNFEDICYSMGSNRPWYYYLQGLAQWNIILSSSSNSMEIATLASPDGTNWVQWCQSDEARPELPLTDKKQENYPVGICIDTAAIHQLPWGENETLPPMPLLHVVSQTGLLSIFNIINLNKSAPQICAPVQPIPLPAAALTRIIPDDAPTQPEAPPAVPLAQPKPQPPQMQPQQPPVQPQQPPVQSTQVITVPVQQPIPVVPKPVPQPQSNVGLSTATFGVKKDPSPPTVSEVASSTAQSKPSAQAPKSQPVPSAEAAAALLEQDKINKAKMIQKLKSMLVKEVNDFNMEMYKFLKLAQEKQQKFQQDIESANLSIDLDMDPERLRKDCSIEELRETVVQLKLEMVRACAVIAEARTQAEAKDLQEWTQADPLTTKRIASVKKLAYYVQTQLDHARKALDHKWNEMSARAEYGKPGERMIRPILDDVYQPLVKQQEILSRQMVVLKTLRNTMNECNITPMFKSTSLLRSTPFRNKDPLSKLTKNILNMSIEPQNKPKDHFLSSQKLDALRDILSNHKPIKIKPVNVELRQHLESMKQRYEKSAKEKEMRELETRQETAQPNIQKPVPISVTPNQPTMPSMKIEQPTPGPVHQTTRIQQDMPQVKTDMKKDSNVFMGQKFGTPTAFVYTQPFIASDTVNEPPINIPTYTPVSNLKPAAFAKPPVSVARTLFTDEKEKPAVHPEEQSQQQPNDDQPKQFNANINSYTKSQLRKFILKDASNDNVPQANEPKSDANTFMGQNICSPTAFAFSKPNASAPSVKFGSKPVDVTNAFSKTTAEPVPTATVKPKTTAESIPTATVKPKSSETGEPEAVAKSNDENKPGDKPITNMFTLKTTQFSGKSQNVPDVLKSSGQGFVFGKADNKATEVTEKPKETSAVKASSTQDKPGTDNRKEEIKPVAQMLNKPPAQSVIFVDLKKPAAEAKVEKVPSSVFDVSTAAPPPTGSKLQFEIGPMTTEQSAVFETPKQPVAQENSSKSDTSESASTSSEPNVSEATPTPISTTDTTTPTSKPITATVTTSTPTKPAEAENVTDKETNVPTDSAKDSPDVTTTSAFSSPATGSVFSPSTTSPSTIAFSTEDTKPIVFSTPTPTSVFESNTALGSTQPSAFASSASSLFASASAYAFGPQTTKPSIFPNTTTTHPIFRTPSLMTSVFGNASSEQSKFSSASSSVFGATPTTTQNIFGTSTTQASVFGSGQSVFGTPATQTSIFGTPTPTTQPSVFGSPTQTTQASVFGTPSPSAQASVFGTPTTTQSGSLFGGADSNLFASATISTTSASNIFGGGSSGPVFGNTNIFSGKATFSGSNPTAASIFGGGNSFGQKPANDFWSGGSNTGGFGNSAFGQGATTQASSIFGGSGGSFSTPSAGQAFGSPQGPFSGGEAKPSVFGTPQQQTAPAFGGSPVFGSKPVFGGSPTFGSTAFGGFNKSPSSGFGAPAAFGGGAFGGSSFGNTSPGKGFGTAAPSFASPTQSNATFESLATTQNTLTFGNLAQQSGQASQSAPGFNTSPSFTGWRG